MRTDITSISGPRLRLRLVKTDDAAYIHGLRTNPAYNVHLSAVTGTVDDQRHWIEAYKTREATGSEYYFVTERREDARRCGAVRLYDIGEDHFTWGSWILDANKPPKGALESAVLSLGIGFELLGKALAHIEVRRDNARAIAFYRRFGMAEADADKQNYYFEYYRDKFLSDKPGHLRILEEAPGTSDLPSTEDQTHE